MDLLDDKDTFGGFVPGEPLAGRVLNVPAHTNTNAHFRSFSDLHRTTRSV